MKSLDVRMRSVLFKAQLRGMITDSDQLGAAGEAQLLHDLAHILRVVAVGDQQRVLGVHDDQVLRRRPAPQTCCGL